ncbi:MAG TPA: hypothetical protein VFN48_05945 [Solirubrobacteraceae bacterium]|nr:hypothetical protein [Solirubrobacteraceae bacterium]
MAVADDRGARAEALVWSACSAMVGPALRLLGEDPSLARYDLATATVCGEPDLVARVIAEDPARANMFFTPLARTPLHYATFSRLGRLDPARAAGIREVVWVLLAAGADPNLWFSHEGWVQAPIYGAAGIAGDPEMTRMLLEAGADPNDRGPDQEVGEALFHAAELAHPTCAELLLRAGADPTAARHCLGRALDFDRPEMVATFVACGVRADAGHVHQAVWRRRGRATVTALLEAGAPVDAPDEAHGLTPVMVARRWGDDDVVGALISAGADPERPEPELSPPAAQALLDEMLELAIERGSLADVRRMLDAGARVNGHPGRGASPLGQACWRGRVAIVAELLHRGARTQFVDGGTALGATRHGAGHCNDPQGGQTSATAEEIDQRPYREIEELLAVHGGLGSGDGNGPGRLGGPGTQAP